MMSVKLGRNDPCHCGSGKKYKRCHMEADRKAAPPPSPAAVPEVPDAEPPKWNRRRERARRSSPQRANFSRTLRGIRDAARLLPASQRCALEAELGPGKVLLRYAEREAELLKASEQLEAHRAEFERLLQDDSACTESMERLFSEERFAELRFTPAEVEAALKSKGNPAVPEDDNEWLKLSSELIASIVDDERREVLSMTLALHIPDLVRAGRFMDAWMVQLCSSAIVDKSLPVDPFLVQMFDFGFEAWEENHFQHIERVFGELGLEAGALKEMSWDELDRWLKEQQSDPVKRARLEEIFALENPDAVKARTELHKTIQDAAQLFDTPQGQELLLSPEEFEPWLLPVMERLQEFQKAHPKEQLTPELHERLITEILLPGVNEVAERIFIPERVLELKADLTQMREEALANGDPALAARATAAAGFLARGASDPARKTFLAMVTHRSLVFPVGQEPPGETAADQEQSR